MVTAGELAAAYADLASDGTDVGLQVRQWMREVPTDQTFGVRRVVCDTLEIGAEAVGVKCGWFGGERAHAIVLAETRGRTIGAAVTTSRSPDAANGGPVREAFGKDVDLIAVHEMLAGEDIRSAICQAIGVARKL